MLKVFQTTVKKTIKADPKSGCKNSKKAGIKA